MKVTREEIVKLAMRAAINEQSILGSNLRDVAVCMDNEKVKETKGKIDLGEIDRLERRILLNFEEIS